MGGALAFLTPFGRATEPTPGAMTWFPLVGSVIGLAVGGSWWLAGRAFPVPLAAAVALAVDAAVTGCLHLDGLADSGDGLLPPMERARRLEVMRDPAVGAFGAITLGVFLLLRFGALTSARPAVLVVAALWAASRTAMVLTAWTLRYARHEGIATPFIQNDPERWRLVLSGGGGLVLSVVLAVIGRGWRGLAAVGVGILGFGAVIALARARIGGYTGDVLGAAGVVGETLGLMALATTWT